MWVKKKTTPVEIQNEVSAVVEPHAGHSDDEVTERLRALGASEVEVLGPGFISVLAKPQVLHQIESIASVGVKKQKQLFLNAY